MTGNGEIKIEKGVPPPARIGKSGRRYKYPFRQMEIGDSFLVPLNGSPAIRVQNNVGSASRWLRDRKFRTSIVDGGVRVWRIE